jgi:glutamate carboxypeptidase
MEILLQNYFNNNLDKYLGTLRQMVSINSFTANPKGVNAVAELTAEKFSGLGFKPEFIPSKNQDFGNHLVLTRAGNSEKIIGLITHLDTVFPPEEEKANKFFWRIEGDRIYGPGTNDIKGGTVMILMIMEALHALSRDLFDEITWVILANAAEERWSYDFGELCRQRLLENSLAALVFEAGYFEGNQLSLVTSRKGMAVYDIKVEGKSAHAGNGHSAGANALVQMAEIIHQASNLTNLDKDLTFNIGFLKGGTVPNRVPHYAEARGEMRTFNEDIFKEGVRNLLELNSLPPLKSIDGDFSCSIDIQVILENPPWPLNKATEELFTVWNNAAKTLGMTVIPEARGGLSDGNQIWDQIPTIDGLGPSGRHAHCSERSPDGSKNQEYVTISSFIPKAILNVIAIRNLVKNDQ